MIPDKGRRFQSLARNSSCQGYEEMVCVVVICCVLSVVSCVLIVVCCVTYWKCGTVVKNKFLHAFEQLEQISTNTSLESRALYDFSNIFQFFYKITKITNKCVFFIFFPPERNFDIDARDGGGGGPFRTKHPQQFQEITKRIVRTIIVHTSGTFLQKTFKSIFKISSYIQKNTQNPINALRITVFNTKHTKHI